MQSVWLYSRVTWISCHMIGRLPPGSNPTLAGWHHMDSIELLRTPSSDDDEEFFDAHGNGFSSGQEIIRNV